MYMQLVGMLSKQVVVELVIGVVIGVVIIEFMMDIIIMHINFIIINILAIDIAFIVGCMIVEVINKVMRTID